MAILTYPLNGIQYNAEDAEAYLCTRESGVYSAENNFALEITGAMQVTIGKGIAWIKNEDFAGKVVKNDTGVTLTIPIADGVLNRIDRIVVQFNKAENATQIVLKQGTLASSAVAPAIVRDGTIYELGLYEITVNAGITEITEADIKNTMLDETVCGLMRDGVTGIPTETFYRQAEAVIENINQILEETLSGNILRHASTHAEGGSDEITPEMIRALSVDGGNMQGTVDFNGVSNPIDFGSSGWIRGRTVSGSKFDIFGYSDPTTLQVGGTSPALAFRGKNTRPTYNGNDIALRSDVPSLTGYATQTWVQQQIAAIAIYDGTVT